MSGKSLIIAAAVAAGSLAVAHTPTGRIRRPEDEPQPQDLPQRLLGNKPRFVIFDEAEDLLRDDHPIVTIDLAPLEERVLARYGPYIEGQMRRADERAADLASLFARKPLDIEITPKPLSKRARRRQRGKTKA
jgi:hypothetical protein